MRSCLISVLLVLMLVSCNNNTAKVSLAGTSIRSILQDKTGAMWFGSDDNGLYRYDGTSFSHFTTSDGLPADQIRSIAQDTSGIIWIGTAKAITRYDGASFATLTPGNGLPPINLPSEIKIFPPEHLSLKPGSLWFAAQDGAYRYDGRSFTYVPLPQSDSDIQLRKNHPNINNRPYAIYSLFEDKDGNIWFGTENRGVYRYDGTWFTHFTKEDIQEGAVRAIARDSSGGMWFGHNLLGLYYSSDGRRLLNYSDEYRLGNPDYVQAVKEKKAVTQAMRKEGKLAAIMTMICDRNGNLWIGTFDSGLWRYDHKKFINYTTKDGLSGNSIMVVYEDPKGMLWIGTAGNGVLTYDGKTFTPFTD